MKPTAFSRFCSVASVWLVAAGCQSLRDVAGVNGAPPAGFVEIAGRVADRSSAPLAGVRVFLPFGVGRSWSGTSGTDGTFRFLAKVADLAGVSPVRMVMYKEGYAPSAFLLPELREGIRYDYSPDSVTSLRPLAWNERVPTGGELLYHIGDDSTDGGASTRLQMGLSGPSKWLTLGTWYWTIRRVYRTATIQFAARGIHTTLCPGNAITVGTLNGGTGIAFPSDTGAHSGFAVYEVTVPILDGEDGAPWLVRAIAGRCSTVDLDDWEFGQVVITLNP